MSERVCPVCTGSGLVHSAFYVPYDVYAYTTSAIPQRQTCRTCGGVGIVDIEGTTMRRYTVTISPESSRLYDTPTPATLPDTPTLEESKPLSPSETQTNEPA